MDKPLHLITDMDLVYKDLEFQARVALDYFRAVAPIIHSRREDCEPGTDAFCLVRSVKVLTQDPVLRKFSHGELIEAAQAAVDGRIEWVAAEAEQHGFVRADPKHEEVPEKIFPGLHAPRLPDPVLAPVNLHDLAAPGL